MSAQKTFESWWEEFKMVAVKSDWGHGNDKASYREYWEDGDSPEEALATEMSYSDDDGDF